jgi:hypothetical protein
MRRENAGCVTCRSSADREKLCVSARLTKSSSHLISMVRIIHLRRGERHLTLAGFRTNANLEHLMLNSSYHVEQKYNYSR